MRLVASAAALALLISVPAYAQTPSADTAPPADTTGAPPPGAPPVMGETAPAAPPPIVTPPVVVPVVPVAAAAPAPASTLKQELLVDSYYMYNFSGTNAMQPPSLRNYDTQSNSFTVNYAKMGLQVDSELVTVRADIGFGQLAALLGGTPGPYSVGIQQAYASLRVPGVTQLSIDFGRFNTTAGAEVIEANRNWLYSRSFLFFVIPVHHTGVRLNYKVNDMISLQATLANGIFADMPDVNNEKTFGGSITIAPLPTTSIVATTYIGKEGPEGNEGANRITADLVVAHNFSDRFGLNLNADYVKLGETSLAGAALMGRYVAAEHLNLALRGEFIKDDNTVFFTGGENQVYEGTFALGVPFSGNLEIRAEFRADFANNPIFVTEGTALMPTATEDTQLTGTIAFLGFI